MAMIEQMVNREIEEKIRRTLTPYLGLGNFQVSVISQLNMDRTTTSETIFDPDSRVERSVRVIRENALTQNSSTAAATTVQQKLPDQATVTGDGGKNSNETNERREELTNYEVSSKTIETAKDGYTVEKLSIAVLVNKARLDATTADPTVGAADPSATTADPNAVPVGYQLMEIEQLIASAAGFSKERGDQLKVAAVPFAAEEITPEPEPGVVDLLVGQLGSFVNGLAAIVVALLVVLLGLRPAVKAIMARPALTASEAAMIAGPDAVDDGGGRAGRPPDADGGNLIEDVTRKIDNSPRKRLEQIVDFDEEQAAAILRQWLHQDRVA
jgi:flagellar M-ring protein FliF